MVSVIVTVYNASSFLDEAISSVLIQKYRDLELLIVDDGSTDGSFQLAENWRRRDKRVHVLFHKDHQNRGISASRNLGIDASNGYLIAFLDSDDVWLSDKLERQVDDLRSNTSVAMTFGAAKRWYSWSPTPHGQDFVVPSAIPGFGSDCVIPPPELLAAYLQDESLTPCTCTVLVHKQCLLQIGGFEESFRGLYDDQVFYAKIALTYPVYVSSTCLANYRQHLNSCCAQARTMGVTQKERQNFLRWLKRYRAACNL